MSDPENVPEGVDDLRAQIDHTRDELADTVQALAAKTDVKGRAKAKAQETTEQAKVRATQFREQAPVRFRAATAERPWLVPAAGAGGLVALVLGGWLALRGRK